MSMDLLAKHVERSTDIPGGMREADATTLAIFLTDWETARRHLDRQITALSGMRDRAEIRDNHGEAS